MDLRKNSSSLWTGILTRTLSREQGAETIYLKCLSLSHLYRKETASSPGSAVFRGNMYCKERGIILLQREGTVPAGSVISLLLLCLQTVIDGAAEQQLFYRKP